VRHYRNLILALVTCVLPGLMIPCQADSILVEQPMSSGQIKWTSAFDIEVTTDEIIVGIGISLLVPKAVNRPLLDDKIVTWKAAIDSTWNKRFYTYAKQAWVPIKFDIKFTHFNPHHRVIIHPGSWIANQHNWYLDTPAPVVAHEIGHMLGAFDEYNGGALSPQNLIIDNSSIMGGEPATGVAYPRHLHLLTKMLAEHFDDKQIKIVAY